jgi:hypothetical protein
MLPLGTKQSGGKLLPHSDLRGGGVFLGGVSRNRQRKRDILVGTWNGDHWGDPDVDGRIILRGISWKWGGLWGLDGAGSG